MSIVKTTTLLSALFFAVEAFGQKGFPDPAAIQRQANPNPQNITPSNETVLNEAEMKKPLRFQWVPVNPLAGNSIILRRGRYH